ncbi:NXPE family member 3-like [Neosynchiropus ocellatus]
MKEKTNKSSSNRKYASLVVVLAIFVTVYLLRSMDNVKGPRRVPTPMAWQFHKGINNTLDFHKNISAPPKDGDFCKFKPLSSEDAQEERLLVASIAWPETSLLPSNFSLGITSNPRGSKFTILPNNGGQQHYVGDLLKVSININDFQGNPKKTGGDYIIARLHNPVLLAGVVGKVVDHLNGSYTAVFPLLWNGSAAVEVTLIHPSEAISFLHKLNKDRPDRIKFVSVFRKGRKTEASICNVCLRPRMVPMCNFTDIRTGEPWFCYKPKKLDCDSRISHTKIKSTISVGAYQKLFQTKINLKVPIPSSGPRSVNVMPREGDDQARANESFGLSGFYYKGLWNSLSGAKVQRFNNSAISRCLQGKVLHLYGDSTVRQWYEYLTQSLPDLKGFDLHTLKKIGPLMALDYQSNTYVDFQCHGPPIRFSKVPIPELNYVANKLDSVVGGANTVIVIGVWSHFSSFPVEIYIRRLQSIRKAVVRLLARAPATVVVIRTANPKKLLLYETLTNSDFYTMERDKILWAVFKDINVHWVDAWEMTVSHYLPHELHPQPPIIKNMIDVLLSHVCPDGSG